jgi:hypothetical protein
MRCTNDDQSFDFGVCVLSHWQPTSSTRQVNGLCLGLLVFLERACAVDPALRITVALLPPRVANRLGCIISSGDTPPSRLLLDPQPAENNPLENRK